MAKGKAQFPGWYFGPGGASQLCENEGEVPKGWTDNQAEALAADAKGGKVAKPTEEKPKPPAAGTANGVAATPAKAKPVEGSTNPLVAARAEYKKVFGKNPSPRWDAAAIAAKIAEGPEKKPAPNLDL